MTFNRVLQLASQLGTLSRNSAEVPFLRFNRVDKPILKQHCLIIKSQLRQGHHMTILGYARVSSVSQDLSIQLERLKAAGCEVIRQEKVSGKSRDGRTELQTVLDFIRPGDQLVICKLDRLGRSTRDVLNLVHELEQKGASLRVLEPDVSTAGPMGKVMLTVLGMVAEMELGFIKERQAAGIAKAKAKGVYRGRKPSIEPLEVMKLANDGKGATEIAAQLGISRASVYRALAN
jgi:DNA invertase Pin-like site-specific DNA recombinase